MRWQVDQDESFTNGIPSIGIVSDDGIIAEVYLETPRSLFVADLIAAAPEMLEALELILNDNRLMNALNKQQSKAVMYAVEKARN